MKVVKEFPIEMSGLLITAYINVLPLGSCDALIGMDWLEQHRAKVECYDKVIECFNKKWELIKVQGKTQTISIRKISTLQLRKFFKKGF